MSAKASRLAAPAEGPAFHPPYKEEVRHDSAPLSRNQVSSARRTVPAGLALGSRSLSNAQDKAFIYAIRWTPIRGGKNEPRYQPPLPPPLSAVCAVALFRGALVKLAFTVEEV